MKHFLKMVVVIALVLGAMAAMGLLDERGTTVIETLFYSWRGGVLAGALVLLSAVYPRISFGRADVRGDLGAAREDVINAFATYGYSPDGGNGDGGAMVFRANSLLRRLLWQFDDAVTVVQHDRYIRISGTKKIVPRVELRLNSYLSRREE